MPALNLGRLGVLLAHSLRQESRSVAAHRFRIGSLVIAFWVLVISHFYSFLFGSLGREFVRALTYLDLLLILIAGSSYFGSVITEEKEQGTLGLLKIAGFSDVGLLFGKSTTRIATALVIFLMQVPFAFLAVVLGGTSAKQIIAAYLALAAYLILLGNVGLFASVVSRKNSSAAACTFAIGGLLLWSGNLASFSMTAGISRKVPFIRNFLSSIVEWQSWFSTENRLREIIQSRSSPVYTAQFWGSLLAAGVLFALSWILFQRTSEYSDGADSPPARSTPHLFRRWRMWVSQPRYDALAWKEFHFAAGGYSLILGKSLTYALLFFIVHYYEASLRRFYATNMMEVFHGTLAVILIIELLSFAGRFLGGEVQQGTLPNLCLTPHSFGRITFSKLIGTLPTMLPTLVALLVVSSHLAGKDALLLEWTPIRYFLVGAFVVLLHLTAFFSLKVRRGALAWAMATLILAMIVVIPLLEAVRMSLNGKTSMRSLFNNSSGPEFWAPLVYLCILSCLGLQLAVVHQARRSVGE